MEFHFRAENYRPDKAYFWRRRRDSGSFFGWFGPVFVALAENHQDAPESSYMRLATYSWQTTKIELK